MPVRRRRDGNFRNISAEKSNPSIPSNYEPFPGLRPATSSITRRMIARASLP